MHLGYALSAGSNGEARSTASPAFVCDVNEAVCCQSSIFIRLAPKQSQRGSMRTADLAPTSLAGYTGKLDHSSVEGTLQQ